MICYSCIMKKLLGIIILSLLSLNYAEAATNNEAKNKKFVYKSLEDLKTIIKKEDPTDLKELKFIKKSQNKEIIYYQIRAYLYNLLRGWI